MKEEASVQVTSSEAEVQAFMKALTRLCVQHGYYIGGEQLEVRSLRQVPVVRRVIWSSKRKAYQC
jgi:hypothetical protein